MKLQDDKKKIRQAIREVFDFRFKGWQDNEDAWTESDTYLKVLKHRKTCEKWKNSQLCLECFGGGLKKFTIDLRDELKKKFGVDESRVRRGKPPLGVK